MNIHEYQAKALLKEYGAPVAAGVPIMTEADVDAAIEALPGPLYVVKSQIHAGGRGKGKFKELAADAAGGVRLAFNPDEVRSHVKEMLGNTLVTKQTGPAGKQVNRLYLEDGADIDRELYLSVLVDRETGLVSFVASTEGGMDIEAVAEDTPELIHTIGIDPEAGCTPADVAKLVSAFKIDGAAAKDAESLFPILYNAFVEKDMSLLEVNPLIVMKDGHLRVLDAKCSFDGNAEFRHPELQELRDNFLDVGGGATVEKVTAAFKIITSDPQVKGILVNIFGGIMRCDVIAEGVVTAVKDVGLKVPLVVRLEGTKVEEGKKIINESDVDVVAADDLDDAAQKIVKAVKG